MRDQIIAELTNIERAENVRILYAVESGSRAWGFPSRDSDYDVRFLYVRPVDAYLTIAPPRDVIETPIADNLDINGWDMPKALTLFQKSNPSILEWLHSPIVYCEQFETAAWMRSLEPTYVTLRSSMYHYLNLAKGQFYRYMQGERVLVKKYFYVLRPILACGWLLEHGTFPPLDFTSLVRSQVPPDGELTDAIIHLLARKIAGDEFDLEMRIPAIHDFLVEHIAAYESRIKTLPEDGVRADPSRLTLYSNRY